MVEWCPGDEVITNYNRYQVGVTCFPGREDEEVRHMMFLVAYDISCPRRLRQVAEACEDYGIRVEKSVFECDLRDELFQDLWLRLIDLINEDEDAVVAYRICKSCLREVESMGQVLRVGRPLYYLL